MKFCLIRVFLIAFLLLAYSRQSAGEQSWPSNSDPMQVKHFRFVDCWRMMRKGSTPSLNELQGQWAGINKGIATCVIDEQFIKEFRICGGTVVGDNIKVQQVSPELLHVSGWQPKIDSGSGELQRVGRFAVKAPRGRGPLGQACIISYRAGASSKLHPQRVLVDKLVKLDDDHMLGRATARIAGIPLPLAYFVLERID